MIVDKIENYQRYFKGEIFHEIFSKLKEISIETPNGEYFRTKDYYFKVMSYETKLSSSIVESHRKEVDIQLLLSGNERIGVFSSENVTIKEDYNDKIDCVFYNVNGEPHSVVDLNKGLMAVFFSDDIHNPQLAVKSKVESLKKVVIKINEKVFA